MSQTKTPQHPRLIRCEATVMTTDGPQQTTGLALPHTGLGLTPTQFTRYFRRAALEPWTVTHLATGRAIATGLTYDTARGLIRALAAMPIDWTAEKVRPAVEERRRVAHLISEARTRGAWVELDISGAHDA